MASNAWWAYGSEFKIGDDGTTESFTKVAEVVDISGPNMSRDAIEVTSQDSTSGWREFIPGMRDGGEVSVTANWIPVDLTHDDGSDGVLAHFQDNVLHNWKIVTADDGSSGTMDIDFAGIVTNFDISLPLEEQAQLEFTIKVSGAVTIDTST
jgi:predicted secreted protein